MEGRVNSVKFIKLKIGKTLQIFPRLSLEAVKYRYHCKHQEGLCNDRALCTQCAGRCPPSKTNMTA